MSCWARRRPPCLKFLPPQRELFPETKETAMGLPYAKALPGEKPWKPLAQHRAIERAFSALEVAPVRKNYGEPAKDPHLAFETGIPKPAPRTKQPRRIRDLAVVEERPQFQDRKSTRLNSSHGYISYAVFCLKKKKKTVATTDM